MFERLLQIILQMQLFMLPPFPQTYWTGISVEEPGLVYVSEVPQVIAMCIPG